VEAGAEFAITQPVFDAAEFRAFVERIREHAFRDLPGSCRSRARGTPSSWPTKCRASAFPTPSSSGCAAPTPTGRAAEEGLAIAREIARPSARSSRACRSRPPQGHRHGAGRHRSGRRLAHPPRPFIFPARPPWKTGGVSVYP
jgi:hypothetical protein